MKKIIVSLALFTSFTSAIAQMTVDSNATGLQLAQYLAGGGVNISNLTLNCPTGAFAKFNGGNTTSLGINEGVALTTGTALELPQQSTFFASAGAGKPGDVDLDAILATYPTPTSSEDACVLEFDIQVNGDSLNFNYVFGSEEYPNYTCSQFTDIFAFLISGPNPQGGNYAKQNIALIPGTNLPVSINTVNSGQPSGGNDPTDCVSLAYSSFFNNTPTIVYDGHTSVFTASIATVPCQNYRLKLAIADAGDGSFDSGVMLEAYSFTAANITISPGTNGNPLFVNAVEGCSPSGFVLSIDNVLNDPFTISYAIGGTATEGTDYPAIPKSVTLNPGQTTAIVDVNPIFDGLNEGVESVVLYLLNSCTNLPYDSAVIFIQDSVTAAAVTPDDNICIGEKTQIVASGGLSYVWTPASTLSSSTIYNPIAAPSITTTYNVTVTVGPCSDDASVTITVIDPLFSVNAGPDDTLCLNEAATIPLQVSGNQSPYSYNWNSGIYLSDSTIQNPVTTPKSSVTYEVIVAGANGCTQRDTINYVLQGVGPKVIIDTDRNFVCAGDTVQLTANIYPLTCGLNIDPCTGTFGIGDIGNGNAPFGNSPFGNFSQAQRTQMLYRASELNAAGIGSVTISDVVFDVVAQGTIDPFDNFTVKIGCTDAQELTEFQTGLSTVYSNSYQLTGSGPNTITLDNAYDWDGVSNLVIEICYETFGLVDFDEVASNTQTYPCLFQANPFNEPACSAQFGFSSQNRPNLRLIYCQNAPKTYTFNWTPTNNLITPDILNPKAIVDNNITYILNVSDSTCSGSGVINLNLANYAVFAGNDTVTCNVDGIQLNAVLVGDVPLVPVNCGVNNTPCTSPSSHLLTGPLNPFASLTPFAGAFNEDLRHQYLYRATDLSAAGIEPGTISSIGFNVNEKLSLGGFQNFSIKMSCTSLDEFDFSPLDWEPTQTVYTSAVVNTTLGWNEFTLNSNFDWDGNSNLLVEICWDNPDGTTTINSDVIETINTNYVASFNGGSALDVGCDLPTFTAFANFELPVTRFKSCASPFVTPNYSWLPTADLNNPNVSNPIVTPTQATTYTVSADFPGGCVVTDTIVVGKGSLDAFVLFNDTIIIEGSTIQLFADVTNAVGVTNYQWTPVTFLDNSNAQNPFATPTEDVLYIVTANNQGCIDTASVLVRLRLPDDQYAIPNAFTPNGDGKNDVFFPYFPSGSGLFLKEMRVYNRWGALVYNGTTGWDGTFNGKPQQAGTFIYYIVVEQPSKTTEGKQGSVTLIR